MYMPLPQGSGEVESMPSGSQGSNLIVAIAPLHQLIFLPLAPLLSTCNSL